MTVRKQISELEKRISALEAELDSVIRSFFSEYNKKEDTVTYEEVMDQWLNGKEKM